jgi:hypothetical protein
VIATLAVMNSSKPIQIFKPGTHTAMSGAVLAFSEGDLQASAAAYDPAKHEAPLVVGHPKHDAPAYGWVKSLSAGDGLSAEPQQVDPAFAEMVGRGAFKKISASFYSPDSPQNPVPGVYYLRHVGFLGAQPPAVKGLRNPEFADAEEGVVEFADWSDIQNASLWRRMRDFIISQFGLDKADSVIPDYAVASLEQEARSESADETVTAPAFSDSINQETSVTPEQKAALEAENAQLKQKLAEAEARDKKAQAAARHTEHAAFAESLVTGGKLLPVHKEFTVAFMDHLAGEAGVVEFGEGSAKQTKSSLDAFRDFLSAAPKVVDFKEHGAAAGDSVDAEDPTAIHSKAVEFQETESKAGRTVDIATAVAHVMNQA